MQSNAREGILSDLLTFFKGMAIGAANVIPGVSGGTIAFITGIFERLINALKSFDVEALRLLRKFEIRKLMAHVDFRFLAWLLGGVGLSILTLAKALEWMFKNEPVLIWAFFLGLILVSIFYVGAMVKRWSAGSVATLLLGTAIAASIAFLTPASENPHFIYLIVCGIVAVCSMIVPGLSGSFVLLLMGNYMLVLGSISDVFSGLKGFDFGPAFTDAFKILVPIGIGCVVGLATFSRLLSWVFAKHHDLAVGLLTGFVLGSLPIIWPWKQNIHMLDAAGAEVLKKGEPVTIGYEWHLPDFSSSTTHYALGLIVLGAVVVWGIEKLGAGKSAVER
jgi:putative membrane protein